MGINTLHTIGALVVGGSGAFNLDGVTNYQADPGLSETIQNAGGQVDASYVATMSNAPTITATVTDIATALATIGISGMAFPQTTVITTVDAYFTKIAQGGTRESSTAHMRVRCNEGLIVPRSISWQQNGVATMQLEIHTTYDGTNAPFIYGSSVALPHTPSVDELFTGGKVSINGTELDGVQGVTFNFGIEVIKESSGGEIYPTFVAIGQRRPRFEIKTKEVPSLSTFGLTGTAQGSTDSVIYLQKITENGTRVAAATTEHIAFTVDDGLIWCQPFGGENNASSEGLVIIQPTYDGSNAVVAISAASAIS